MAVTTSTDPFSSEDLDRILHEETCNSEAEGWHFVKKTDLAEIWKKDSDESSVKLIKAFLSFPNIPPADVLEMIKNLDVRKNWDKQFPLIEVVEEFPTHRVVYWQIKTPPGMTNRDLLQFITHRRDEARNFDYILYKNAVDDRKPEQHGFVRAATILSGVIIRADENDANSSRMTLMMQNDPKGLIPKNIFNHFAAKSPSDWQEHLIKYYREVYSKEKK